MSPWKAFWSCLTVAAVGWCLGFGGGEWLESRSRLAADTKGNPKSSAAPRSQRAKPDQIASALRGKPIFRNAVRSVVFSPDGKLLAAGCGDGIIRLWDVGQKKIVRTVAAHDNWVFDLAFTPEGVLVSGGGDDLVRLIATDTGKIRETFHDHKNDLHGVAVSPSGEWLVSGSDDTRIMLRSLKAGTVKELGRHEKQVTSVTISPNGKWAASSSRDHTIRLWDLSKQKLVRELSLHEADVITAAFSPDSTKIVTGGYDRTVRIWDVTSGKQLTFLPGHGHWVFTVQYSPDGKQIFTGGGDHILRMFGAADGKVQFQSELSGDVADIAILPDGKLLAAGTSDGTVRFFAIDGTKAKLLPEKILIPVEQQEGEGAREAPVKNVPAKKISTEDYLKQHRLIRAHHPDWAQAAAELNDSGDAFTLFLLNRIDPQKLQPDEAEVRIRVIQHIEQRRGENPDQLKFEEIELALNRAASADLACDPLEGLIVRWLRSQLREQASKPESRKRLIELRDKLPSPKSDQRLEWGHPSERMRQYINRALTANEKGSPTQTQ